MAEEILYGASGPRVGSAGPVTRQNYWPLKLDLSRLLVDDHTFFVDHQGYSGNFYWGVRSVSLPSELNDAKIPPVVFSVSRARELSSRQRPPGEDETRWVDHFRTTAFADDGLKPIEFVSELHRSGSGDSWWSVMPAGSADAELDVLSANTHVLAFIEQQSKTAAEWLYHETYFDKIGFRTMLYVDRTHSESQLLGWYMID